MGLAVVMAFWLAMVMTFWMSSVSSQASRWPRSKALTRLAIGGKFSCGWSRLLTDA